MIKQSVFHICALAVAVMMAGMAVGEFEGTGSAGRSLGVLVRTRPGLALLKAQEFIKRYPAEKKTMNKAMQALAGSTNRKLAELEAKLLEFQEKPPVNELAKKRRATQIKDLAAKARKLDAEYLAKDFLSLETL